MANNLTEVYRHEVNWPADKVSICNVGNTEGNKFVACSEKNFMSNNDTIQYVRYDNVSHMNIDRDMFRRLPPNPCFGKCHGVTVDENNSYMAQERSDKNLFGAMDKIKSMSFETKGTLIVGIALALDHLHSSNVAHGALSLKNIGMLENDQNPIRFESLAHCCSVLDRETKYYQNFIKSRIPKDAAKTNVKALQADLFSLGCIICQIVVGNSFASLSAQTWKHIKIPESGLEAYQKNLVEHLLSFIFSGKAVSVRSVINHPVFYDGLKIYHFLTDVNLLIERLQQKVHNKNIVRKVQSKETEVTDKFKEKSNETQIDCFYSQMAASFHKHKIQTSTIKGYLANIFSHCTERTTVESQVRCFRGILQHLDEKHNLNKRYHKSIPGTSIFLITHWPDLLPRAYDIAYKSRNNPLMTDYF